MKVLGSQQLVSNVIAKDLCIGCGGCINLCPYFTSYQGITSQLFPCTLEQGRCFAYCPRVEVDLDELGHALHKKPYQGDTLGFYLSVHVAKAGRQAPVGSFQSGGTVSSLMSFALKEKLIDSAVLTDRKGLLPVPCTVTTEEDVAKCASSKYTAAPTIAEVNAALKRGHTAIGVVATPCQTVALAKMRAISIDGKNMADRIKLVIGLFCTWALDYKHFLSLLSKRVEVEAIIRIEIPPPPAEIVLVHIKDDTIEIPLSEVREQIPNSCGYCIDMTAEYADLSVGELEGDSGKNTLIVRSDLGQRVVQMASQKGFLEIEEYSRESFEHLSWAANNKRRRGLLQLKESGLLNTEVEDQPASIRMQSEVVERIIA